MLYTDKISNCLPEFCDLNDIYRASGFSIYMVGGCVRDIILGVEPKDFDFATDAPLEFTKSNFDYIATGEDHGTLTIKYKDQFLEVTRFRKDVSCDGRRATIEFSKTIEEDLLRRDLTMNALAINLDNYEIIDVSGGLNDIDQRTIKFVGDSITRVKEDNLRAVRIVRFYLRYKKKFGFKIYTDVLNKIKTIYDNSKVSFERLEKEFEEILKYHTYAEQELLEYFDELKIFECFLKDPNDHKKMIYELFSIGEFYLIADYLPDNFKIAKKYKINNRFYRIATNIDINSTNPKDIIRLFGDRQSFLDFSKYIPGIALVSSEIDRIIIRGDPLFVSDLAINGDDLKLIGLTGKDIGIALDKVLKYVLENPDCNSKFSIMQLLQEG